MNPMSTEADELYIARSKNSYFSIGYFYRSLYNRVAQEAVKENQSHLCCMATMEYPYEDKRYF